MGIWDAASVPIRFVLKSRYESIGYELLLMKIQEKCV